MSNLSSKLTKEKMFSVSLVVIKLTKSLKNSKKINFCFLLLLLIDMLVHSEKRLPQDRLNSLQLIPFLIFGCKYNQVGCLWSLSLVQVISPKKCLLKLRSSKVLINVGYLSWRKLLIPRKLLHVVQWIC